MKKKVPTRIDDKVLQKWLQLNVFLTLDLLWTYYSFIISIFTIKIQLFSDMTTNIYPIIKLILISHWVVSRSGYNIIIGTEIDIKLAS